MKTYPPLYKLDSKNVVRVWNITCNDPIGTYTVTHGVNGGAMQTTTVTVQPKNVGRSNETNVTEQAELEAESKWKKQQDKGYIDSGQFNPLAGGCVRMLKAAKTVLPMLAKSFKDHGHKITYPCFVQPKLDGIRCLVYSAHLDVPVFVSRKGKEFEHLTHIAEVLKPALKEEKGWILDGELYSDTLDFQTITSIVRKSKVRHERIHEIKYHIYDCFEPGVDRPCEYRMVQLRRMYEACGKSPHDPVVLVPTTEINSKEEVILELEAHEQKGYEGIMLRNKWGLYEQDRRSENLQKVKSFMDEEFEIIGGKEGKGKFEGMCIFRCKTKDGKEFDVMPKGDKALRRSYLTNLKNHLGQLLTVKFFEYTVDGVPRFPVGLAIRDFE